MAEDCHHQQHECPGEELLACPLHAEFAGKSGDVTPCNRECPSAKARQMAAETKLAQLARDETHSGKSFKLHRRWDRAARLFGETPFERLANASVTVFGLGGVGSYTVEGLVRSGVGRVVMVDFDDVCVTNVNRQLHALKGAYSKPKCDMLADRMRLINPDAELVPVKVFYNAETSDALLGDNPDFVVDAIDNMTAKGHLIATCVERGIPLVSSMGAAGKLDPTAVEIADISRTHGCAMARSMRKILRQKYGLGADKADTGVHAVFSAEERTTPHDLSYDEAAGGFLCVCPSRANDFHTCDDRNLIDGSAGFVTSVFGMTCASVVVRTLIGRM
jgi:tRNA threonylcarbamoyladenosine dehydratase